MLMRYSFFMATLHWRSQPMAGGGGGVGGRHLCFAYIFFQTQWKEKIDCSPLLSNGGLGVKQRAAMVQVPQSSVRSQPLLLLVCKSSSVLQVAGRWEGGRERGMYGSTTNSKLPLFLFLFSLSPDCARLKSLPGISIWQTRSHQTYWFRSAGHVPPDYSWLFILNGGGKNK